METAMGRKRGGGDGAPGTPEGARRATGGGTGAGRGERGRFSAKHKTEAVTRLLRGEELDVLSREYGVTAATLSGWRDAFLAAGQAGFKSRKASPEADEVGELKTVIGELTIDNEALKALLRAHEVKGPLARRRSTP